MVIRNKARLVAQGYTQVEGLDFGETYASVTRLEAIWILIAYDCAHNIKLYQMDVKNAFINGTSMGLCMFTNLLVLKMSRSPTMFTNLRRLCMV
jgi:hypothetical protein